MDRNDKLYAIVLGLADTGYGVVRALSQYKIMIIGFEHDDSRPEVKSKLCSTNIYKDEEHLLRTLILLREKIKHTPVLYMTSDELVIFASKNREVIEQYYHIDLPSAETVDLLLSKGKFVNFAEKHGFRIPKTIITNKQIDYKKCLDEMKFPCVVKPYWRDQNWKDAKFPKVFLFPSKESFIEKFDIIFSVEKNLIIQEWIPGTDEDIYFSLVYYNKESICISEFTGRKLRQWPVSTGSTACAEPITSDHVRQETIRLFNTVSYSGFGSVEFKRHAETGEYYIMEPTVGRPNHQSFLATCNGENMPVIAYESLTGINFEKEKLNSYPTIWIDDQFDILSIIVSFYKGQLNYHNLFRSYYSNKAFRFLNRKDIKPFLFMILRNIQKSVEKVIH